MFGIFVKSRAGMLVCIAAGAVFCAAAEQPVKVPEGLEGKWDSSRYISVDEVRPGMEAYCLTVYKGTEVEKFGLDVLSVVRNYTPGRDAILVQGTDERFVHTGPVAGCSGSPVYIDGRLAGALAFGWLYSEDALYGVTPIEEMLRVGLSVDGRGAKTEGAGGGSGYNFDFSRPIDFAEVDREITGWRVSPQADSGGISPLWCPVVTSGLPAVASEQLAGTLRPFGLMVVSGSGSGGGGSGSDVRLEPGACLSIPLVSGDISMDVIGTVTEVRGDEVYGFGHSFLGYGAVNLPMATGQVHTIVSTMIRSFKFASSGQIVGALNIDESAAVHGRIGASAKMIGLKINVERYNDPKKRSYECRIVNDRILTPQLLRSALAGAVLMAGSLPPDNTLEYRVFLGVSGEQAVDFENTATGAGLMNMVRDGISPVALLLNNPYRAVDMDSLDFDIRVSSENTSAAIWSVDLSDRVVKPGEKFRVEVVLECFQDRKRKYVFELQVPKGLKPGRYDVIVCGGDGYGNFLRRTVWQRFVPESLPSLIDAMNEVGRIRRDRLHCILVLPPEGVIVDKAELPDLPPTKALILSDAGRAASVQPYPHWVEQSVDAGRIVLDREVMHITVEE